MYTVSIWHPEKTVWIHFECLASPNCFVSHLIKRKSKRNEALFVMNFLVAALGKCFLPPSAARSPFVCQAKTSFQYEKCVQRHTRVYNRHIYRMQWKSIIIFNICSLIRLLLLSFSASFQCYRCKVLGECVVGNCIPFGEHTLIQNFCHSHMRALCVYKAICCLSCRCRRCCH